LAFGLLVFQSGGCLGYFGNEIPAFFRSAAALASEIFVRPGNEILPLASANALAASSESSCEG
jgi:hypothetical protein